MRKSYPYPTKKAQVPPLSSEQRILNAKGWRKSEGRDLYVSYLSRGKRLPFEHAIHAKCAECCNGYSDGLLDCKVPSCPLYPFMPYREKQGGAV